MRTPSPLPKTVGSLFAGIGGFELGLERAGLSCVWQVEIDSYCQDVLAKHFPEAERYGDVRECGKHNLSPVDVICGGFPCQDVSVAGHRKGLAGSRSGLWHEFIRIVAELSPRWVIVENVPGLLSSNEGRDFATILQGLAECGYLSAWRVLDAQYFGVPQRRRRVFIVGSLGDGSCIKVLFESQGSTRDTQEGKETGETVTVYTPSSFGAYSQGIGTLRYHSGDYGGGSEGLVVFVPGNLWGRSGANPNTEIFLTLVARPRDRFPHIAFNRWSSGDVQPAFRLLNLKASQVLEIGVRRLTPVECERLQGFPDGWTGGQSDTRRYRQLGNAVCVPVAEWIGRRLVRQVERN